MTDQRNDHAVAPAPYETAVADAVAEAVRAMAAGRKAVEDAMRQANAAVRASEFNIQDAREVQGR